MEFVAEESRGADVSSASSTPAVTRPPLKFNLGNPSREEPIWPLRVKTEGELLLIPGPPSGFVTPRDKNVEEALSWFRRDKDFDKDKYPCEEGILFGLKNWAERSDNIPIHTGPELKKLLKTRQGPSIRESQEDVIFLEPGLHLSHWTVDVWIKFPLKGLAVDNVLLGPKDVGLGLHVSVD